MTCEEMRSPAQPSGWNNFRQYILTVCDHCRKRHSAVEGCVLHAQTRLTGRIRGVRGKFGGNADPIVARSTGTKVSLASLVPSVTNVVQSGKQNSYRKSRLPVLVRVVLIAVLKLRLDGRANHAPLSAEGGDRPGQVCRFGSSCHRFRRFGVAQRRALLFLAKMTPTFPEV